MEFVVSAVRSVWMIAIAPTLRFLKPGDGHPRALPLLLLCLLTRIATAQTLGDARDQYRQGQYDECLDASLKAIANDQFGEEWRHLAAKSLMALGRTEEAIKQIESAQERYATSVKLTWLAYETYTDTGKAPQAAQMIARLNDLGGSYPLEYRDAEDLVALGRAALVLGVDPRIALDNFFEKAKKKQTGCIEAYLAAAQVAISKTDFALAGRQLNAALKQDDKEPEVHWMMARAFSGGDRERSEESLDAALSINPHHAPSHLLRAEHRIDAELYDKADQSIESILKTNPNHPEAWGLKAVLAHLRSDAAGEKAAVENALKINYHNARVFHLIGRKLSQKYRFAEAAAYQRRALEAEPDFQQAKIQLATDLLRLGQDQEGWKLADEAHQSDAYNVLAYNLASLKEHVASFATLKEGIFTVRMDRREAAIYGRQVLDLLTRAAKTLTEKYGLELKGPIFVEIFPDQRDFAVRTFGLPGGVGYLGVCFGNVITANSPAAQQTGGRNNWQAVLWHEFCHVITLNLTRNKMPRWLSEGISVYEELAASPAWGQTMTPKYRAMILEGEMQPISRMSAAFMDHENLDFAYYQSSLVVKFIAEKFGLDALKAILRDLGEGVATNQAIEKHTATMAALEEQFAAYAKEQANQLAPKADFSEPEPELADLAVVAGYLKDHPNNYRALTRQVSMLMESGQWAAAEGPLKKLLELWPGDAGRDNPYQLLAAVYRQMDRTEEEKAILRQLADRSGDAVAAYGRLMDLEAQAGNWQAVLGNAQRYLAVNPLVARPYEQLAAAAARLQRPAVAIEAWSRLLLLDPADPALVHYQLAALLEKSDPPAARRHVLQALEEAPRYRQALALLLRLSEPSASQKTGAPQ